MTAAAHHPGDFLAYPTNRVAGTMATAREARSAVTALVAAGVSLQDIDILHGDQALHRLDPDGSAHGPFARVQRNLLRAAARQEEFKHLMWHVDDIKAGRAVVMALAATAPDRRRIATVLRDHGATRIGFYGRWAWEALDDARADEAGRPPQGVGDDGREGVQP